MFIGEYTHTMDLKRRVSLPQVFREELDETVVLTRGLDSCIFLFPEESWQQIADELASLSFGDADSRGLNRFLLSGAREVKIDASGRILVPDFLSDFADLEKEVVFTGVHSRIELWGSDQWKDYTNKVESQADLLAQTLGDVGMI
ncbi:MAG: division/cell wall cluster transcriptional repressor MraZ [Candidatus Paceibacterota bacterium]